MTDVINQFIKPNVLTPQAFIRVHIKKMTKVLNYTFVGHVYCCSIAAERQPTSFNQIGQLCYSISITRKNLSLAMSYKNGSIFYLSSQKIYMIEHTLNQRFHQGRIKISHNEGL